MYKLFTLLIINFSLVNANFIRQLRLKLCTTQCPVCVKCDTKRGTCSLPLTGSACQINNLSGTCSSSGVCVAQSTNPQPPQPLKKCQTYNCPTVDTCSITYLNDGSDCTMDGNILHAYCLNDGCKPVIEALPKTLPAYNFGCYGLPDGILCDTNLNLFDGETCQNGICKFPNGQYNGVLPSE
jgi:hypothetical protein